MKSVAPGQEGPACRSEKTQLSPATSVKVNTFDKTKTDIIYMLQYLMPWKTEGLGLVPSLHFCNVQMISDFREKREGDVWGSPQDFGKGEPQGQGRSPQGYNLSTYQRSLLICGNNHHHNDPITAPMTINLNQFTLITKHFVKIVKFTNRHGDHCSWQYPHFRYVQ